jgi:pyruvate ferredoxin oxidoreductase alpha subunit
MPVLAKTGNEAMAEAMRQINPDVVAAYPITPATEIVMIFAKYVADGLVDTEFVAVESEHSAMSACVGASSAGARVMTGTSSQGLCLMYEILPIATALRLPIVMCDVNRAISGPINIHCDHSDTMAARDFGWVQIFSENSQEAYDSLIQAIRIAEDPRLHLPTMVTTDGFIISHCLERIETLEDKQVKDFVGLERQSENKLLDIAKPVTVGSIDLQDYYFEHRMQVAEAMRGAKKVILDVADEFAKKFGRKYGLFETYLADDADFLMVALGSTCGTARVVVDELRAKGVKAGLIKIRVFRPFPAEELVAVLSKAKAIAVMDRSDTWSAQGGQVYTELRSAMYGQKQPPMINVIYGLGGREITLADLHSVFASLQNVEKQPAVSYLGVRE